MESTSPAMVMPTARQNPFDPPEELRRRQGLGPIHRMTYVDGGQGWLVTGFAAARAVLADPRFSVRPDHMRSPIGQPATAPVPPGFFLRMDPPEHDRYRRLLTGDFTVRRMKLLEPEIEAIVNDQLNAMELAGGPADLFKAFALPIPSQVIGELLGVPYSDRQGFQRNAATLLNIDLTPERRQEAVRELMAYLRDLLRHKCSWPEEDVLSGLAAHEGLTADERAGLALLLLMAGHETTANMLALGTFALLANPAQLAEVRGKEEDAPAVVEELLRYLTVIHHVVRVALEDIELHGCLIKAGESVTVALSAANRDADHFADPDALDLTRSTAGHLAFGHGLHRCLGQRLARAEMRIALPALLRRFPALRLTVAPEQVPLRSAMTVYGVHELPVTW
ncbi:MULTISPECIES: cytochrome P450 [Streptomyces]|uniref:Cytochrome P450-SU2 n=1 Tax=Streptomyces chartreusis NRRL 3882 TaxID=1079985 RepID=A0A2N9AZX7_STRCX|nr:MULTISPECIES: cytochrome P450 [Streptomyces]MYS88043.1 cytochrome P450 [Streptomyces sp. SID5464]SOR76624.1 Cytochrome P450-SU2 [Streptomyces chartreusis NRRL 3882]